MNIIASLNDAGSTPSEAIQTLIENNIEECIIYDTYTDQQLVDLVNILHNNNITINTFITDHVSDKALSRAAYIKAKYICFKKFSTDREVITNLYNRCIGLKLEPMIFFDYTIDIIQYIEVLKHDKIWIMYDPSIILKNSKVDHLIRYMILINKWIRVLIVHDYSTGFGTKLAGQGDCKYDRVLANINRSCYLAIEHGLGSRYLTYDSKPKVFSVAVECLQKCLRSAR